MLPRKSRHPTRVVLRKSQGNSPRFAGSTKLRTVSSHVPLFYDPMYDLSIFYHLSILQSISQSFHNLLPFAISSNRHPLHLQNRFYLSPFSEVHTPLRVSETNAIKCLSHPVFMTRIIKVFTHVPAIPARFFSICRLFLVAINNNNYLFWPVT